MKILENLKLDSWYGIVSYVGILLIAASLFFQVDFIQEKPPSLPRDFLSRGLPERQKMIEAATNFNSDGVGTAKAT